MYQSELSPHKTGRIALAYTHYSGLTMAAAEYPEAAGGSAGADRERLDKKVKFPKIQSTIVKRTNGTTIRTDVLVKLLGAGCSHRSQMQGNLQYSGDLDEQKRQMQGAGGLPDCP